MKKTALLVLFLPLFLLSGVHAGEANIWSPLAIVRFGNIDAIDAEDGDLALFLKSIRNDGRFIPPLHTLVGPQIRNNTFYGLTYEGWIEGVLQVPAQPGEPRVIWVFPVDSRDEYMTQLVNLGLTEYEGMDGVTVLREMDPDGNVHTWHMEWLPGNVAIFGAHREAVAATKQLYAENSAARGLLERAGGRYIEPDIMARVYPERLASWQDREYGMYWWREKIGRLVEDLIAFWRPNPARLRLMDTLAEELALWPRSIGGVDVLLWFEREGIEWRMEIARESPFVLRSELDILRRIPDRTALAYAVPVSPASMQYMGDWAARFLLGAAGGVVSQDARTVAETAFGFLVDAGLEEVASCWVPPPTGRPELGGARLYVTRWKNASLPAEAGKVAMESLRPETAVAAALEQMGCEVKVRLDSFVEGAVDVEISAPGGGDEPPYFSGSYLFRREGDIVAVVGGVGRQDAGQMRQVMEYRAALAAETVRYAGEGGPDVRGAFSRVAPTGASMLALFEPVRFLQLCLVEAADWRPRSPDQHEPLSTQLAREMLEYGSARAWTVTGESEPNAGQYNGSITWQSLSRLSAALGITESISMDNQ